MLLLMPKAMKAAGHGIAQNLTIYYQQSERHRSAGKRKPAVSCVLPSHSPALSANCSRNSPVLPAARRPLSHDSPSGRHSTPQTIRQCVAISLVDIPQHTQSGLLSRLTYSRQRPRTTRPSRPRLCLK